MTAALATLAQRKGVRVLVCDIGDDPNDYSPLARHFGRDRLPIHAQSIAPGIRGVVLLARTGQELFLKSVLHSGTLARAALSSDALRRLLSAGPSFKEMGVFFQLLTLLRAQAHRRRAREPAGAHRHAGHRPHPLAHRAARAAAAAGAPRAHRRGAARGPVVPERPEAGRGLGGHPPRDAAGQRVPRAARGVCTRRACPSAGW